MVNGEAEVCRGGSVGPVASCQGERPDKRMAGASKDTRVSKSSPGHANVCIGHKTHGDEDSFLTRKGYKIENTKVLTQLRIRGTKQGHQDSFLATAGYNTEGKDTTRFSVSGKDKKQVGRIHNQNCSIPLFPQHYLTFSLRHQTTNNTKTNA
ncbi:hypothetical protein E2C01_067223 [Portunus trituberculatus]|uniref:Uncharacterized protein n=1 Tax=Portunus trituberculatus TaxID=210409 RepID=A0A5B7HKF4_PORTR|nr:hypothetical protein [Portunus trituberculatus]